MRRILVVLILALAAQAQAFTTATLEKVWNIPAPRQETIFLRDFERTVVATTATAAGKLAVIVNAIEAVSSMTIPLADESTSGPHLPVERLYARLGAAGRTVARAVLKAWVRGYFAAERDKATADQERWTREEDALTGGLQ